MTSTLTDYPLPVLLASDDVLAVNKPEGLASIPEGAGGAASLLALLEATTGAKLYVVHRLDKEVSGVIVFARHPAAHRHLNDQFASRQVRKTYLALTLGVVEPDSGVIDRPLRQFGSGRMGVDPQAGKPSVTVYEVVQRCVRHTLITAHPLSGRRHQIRVHLYSIGHPIAGDLRYGDKAAQQAYPRLMLHAQEITLRLPSGEAVTIGAPLPASFTSVTENACR